MSHPEIEPIIRILQQGGIILYPTDTIWGIGCDATHIQAVQKIKTIKKRADSKAFLVLCENLEMVRQFVADIPEKAIALHQQNKKPLTLIYPQVRLLPKELLAADGSLGIRIPHFSFCTDLLHALGRPLVSTSANITASTSPLCFSEIAEEVLLAVDYVVKDFHDYTTPFTGSTIVKLESSGEINILRA